MKKGRAYDIALISDKGKVRENNEDSVMSLEWEEYSNGKVFSYTLLALADGVGGGPGGQIASKMGVESFCKSFLQRAIGKRPSSPVELVNAALQDANAEIIRRSEIEPENRGMATTLTAVYLTHEKCYFGHAGDSRCYLIRDNSIELITRDQSIGRVLQQAVGADSRLLPVSGERDLKSGDRLLICSDGLWNAVDDSGILKIVRKKRGSAEACDELVKEANRKGGNDNISIGIARV